MYLNDGFDGRTRTGDSLAEKQLILLYVSLQRDVISPKWVSMQF